MANHGGPTTLKPINTTTCLHSPTIRTIALLIENGIQIRSLDSTFYMQNTKIENRWKIEKHKFTAPNN
jgi:hypothetical protein